MSKVPWDDLEKKISGMSSRSKIFTTKNWQYCCVFSGWLWALFLLLAQVSMRSFPAVPPSWSAEEVHHHYFKYKTGVRASSMFMIVAGGFLLPYAAVISKQMRQISNVDPILCDLQFVSAAAAVFSFALPGIFLSLVTFRDYGPEMTQVLSDLYWVTLNIVWSPFWIQTWSLAWAVFADKSLNPKFPKVLAVINVIAPITYASTSGIHTQHHGPYAWNGALAYWLPMVTFGILLVADSLCLIWNIRTEPESNGEDGESHRLTG